MVELSEQNFLENYTGNAY